MSTTTFVPVHPLGSRGPDVSALGVGTWALGGPWTFNGRDAGWGDVDDDVSIAALHAAIDHGVRVIDTAGSYGAGHSEQVIGRALRQLPSSVRDQVVVSTKFGLVFDETTRRGGGEDVSSAAIRRQSADSLRRLGTGAIDVLQLHGGARDGTHAEEIVTTLEELVTDGTIRWFGTAQDDPAVIDVFARLTHCLTVQTQVNVFGWSSAVLDLAQSHGLSVLARSPLAMGLLSGRYTTDRRPGAGDVRLDTPYWDYFDEGTMDQWLSRLAAVRKLLTADGRTLIQGALGYLWNVNPAIIPLPGIRTVAQAEENATTLALGPLPPDVAAEVTALLADSPERR